MLCLPNKKILLSILSGVMLTLAFPPGKIAWIIWVSFIPLLKSIENVNISTAFRLGMITGLAHYITLLYWITNVLSTYGGLHIIISILILILLCLYLSIYTGIFAILVSRLEGSLFMVIIIAGIWVALEYLKSILLTGFPWCLLGYSQYRYLSLIQISDITGVYGISFIILCVNGTGYLLFRNSTEYSRKKPVIFGIILSSVLISGTIIYGNHRLKEYDTPLKEGKHVEVAVVQGNIDQSMKWEAESQRRIMEKYISLTRSSFDRKPEIIVWPETALPFFIDQHKPELKKQLYKIPMESGAHFILGCPAYKRRDSGTEYFNRAIYISPEGKVEDQYDKNHLVPFGEYVPLKNYLPFVNRLVASAGDFSSGKDITPLNLPGLPSGVLICYEIIFPDISREHVRQGAKILINLTNDAWFGHSSAPYQHLFMSLFRAVENRRPIIRAANTGFSAFIDSGGRIVKRGDLFTEELLVGSVITSENSITLYSRYGDIFAYSIIILCLIKFIHELCYGLLYKKKFH